MRQVRWNEGKSILAFGVALALAGCGGGGGGSGSASGSTVAASTSQSTATSGQIPTSNLTAIDISPQGDIQIFGDPKTTMDLAQQIIVDGYFVDGSAADLTHQVNYTIADPTVAKISGDGIVTALKTGKTTITVSQKDDKGNTLTVTRNIVIDASKGLAGSGKGANGQPIKLEVWPGSRRLARIDSTKGRDEFQQFVVLVTYYDGTVQDVTRTMGLKVTDAATNQPTAAGRITTTGLFRGTFEGSVNVTADLGSHYNLVVSSHLILGTGKNKYGAGSSTATRPPYSGEPLASSTNPIDVAAFVALQSQLIEPSALSTDGEFIRRVTADVAGRLPTPAETAAFVADTTASKRSKLIDTLLASQEFAHHWAVDVVGPWVCVGGQQQAAFDTAIEAELASDTPLSTIVTNLATGAAAEGQAFDAQFQTAHEKSDQLMLTFTGMTSKCGRCHDHPLTSIQDDPKWVQNDNYSLYACFAMAAMDATEIDKSGNTVKDANGNPVVRDPGFVADGANAKVNVTFPKLMDAQGNLTPIAARRSAFASALTQSNAYARGTAHRIWAEIADPLLNPNQFLAANLATANQPAVLAALAQAFKDQKSSLKGFLRVALNSATYQLSTAGDGLNDTLLARRTVRRHHAEVLDAGVSTIAGVPYQAEPFFMFNFGYPDTRTVITERTDAVNMSQAFTLMNSPLSINGKLAMTGSSTMSLAADVDAKKIKLEDAITQIFQTGLSRNPTSDELSTLVGESATAKNTQEALEDVAVSVGSSIEYVMR